MINTPIANRKSIILVGNRNVGKSSIFNALIGQNKSIVSDTAGTTTDPVWTAAEIIGFGPVKIVDTAGVDDIGELGKLRVKKTNEEIRTSDLIIHVLNYQEHKENIFNQLENLYKKYKSDRKEFLLVVNKINKDCLENLREREIIQNNLEAKNSQESRVNQNNVINKNLFKKFEERLILIEKDNINRGKIEELFLKISKTLKNLEEDRPLLDGIAKEGDTVVLVTPIDSEAPKGRLILPQVQVLRECLDMGLKSLVVRESELEEGLKELKNVDLVITDSKVFDYVNQILEPSIKLTSFSILFSRQKGDIDKFVEACKYLESLKDGDKILIAESCVHTSSHEDIGTVLIPKLIREKLDKDIKFEFSHGKTIPDDLSGFSMIIQCGGCMMSRSNMLNRINQAIENNLPITNYGVVLAYLKANLNRMTY